MKQLSHICLGLLALSMAGSAGANLALRLEQLEGQLGKLTRYHQHNCAGATVARDCGRVEAGIDQVNRAIKSLTGTMQRQIKGAAFERKIERYGTSKLHREYNEHVARLGALNARIEQMVAARVSPQDARLRALQNEASVLHMRLLRLQSRLKGKN